MSVSTLVEAKRLPPPAAGRALRLAAGLTLEDVAGVVGVNRSTVYRWEKGLRTPRGDARVAYAAALGEMREVVAGGG